MSRWEPACISRFRPPLVTPLLRSGDLYLSPEPTSNPENPAGGPDVNSLRHQREEADRAYNDALTALDRAVRQLREFRQRRPHSTNAGRSAE